MSTTEPVLWKWRDARGGHYSKPVEVAGGKGMEALRAMFPDAKADRMNFVLFSTSGVHGSYTSIEEDYQAWLNDEERYAGITFLIVHPRMVWMRYGTVIAASQEDFDFLRALHQSSRKAVEEIFDRG